MRAERAARGIIDAPIDGLEETPVAESPMSEAEIADIAAGPRVSPEAMWTDEQWAAADATYHTKQAESGEKSLAEQHAEHMAAKAEKDAADTELHEATNPDFHDASLEKYGREGLLNTLKGTAEVPHYTGPKTEVATSTHASTGETINEGEVEQCISDAEARRIGGTAGELAEHALTSRPFEEQLVEDTDKGLKYRERGHVGDGIDMVIEVLPDGSLDRVELIIEDPSTSETHGVKVVGPEATQPAVEIDGEPVSENEVPIVEAVLEEVNTVLESEPSPGSQNAEEPSEAKPEPAVESVENKSNDDPELPKDTPNDPQQGEKVAAPEPSPAERVSTPKLTPEQIHLRQQQDMMRFAVPYIRSNPVFLDVFRSMGIDPNKLTPSDVQLNEESLRYIKAIQRQGIRPDSMILREAPHAGSTLGRTALESQELVKGLLGSMFQGKVPEQK